MFCFPISNHVMQISTWPGARSKGKDNSLFSSPRTVMDIGTYSGELLVKTLILFKLTLT